MIDTGAAPNLIKIRNRRPEIYVQTQQSILLSGITDGNIKTLGAVEIKFMGYAIILQVVTNDFPISQEGILGSDFLCSATKIDFVQKILTWRDITIPFTQRNTVIVPPRSRLTIPVRIVNSELSEGYVPRINICENVYLGSALVANRDGRALISVINASEIDQEIEIPIIQLEEVEIVSDGRTSGASLFEGRASALGHGEPNSTKNDRTFQVASTTEKTVPRDERKEQIKTLLRLDHLNDEETAHVNKLINKYNDLFHIPSDPLGYTNAMRHKINTTDNHPVYTKQYRYPPIHKEEINKQIEALLDNGTISPSDSPYNSPLWIVPKKPDSLGNKRWRMVIDYRTLNEKTIGDAYPLPNITEILDQLGSAKYFSVFDLASGFHQIPMHEPDAQKTAFSTPHGHYQFNRMPFGLKNAPVEKRFNGLWIRFCPGCKESNCSCI